MSVSGHPFGLGGEWAKFSTAFRGRTLLGSGDFVRRGICPGLKSMRGDGMAPYTPVHFFSSNTIQFKFRLYTSWQQCLTSKAAFWHLACALQSISQTHRQNAQTS